MSDVVLTDEEIARAYDAKLVSLTPAERDKAAEIKTERARLLKEREENREAQQANYDRHKGRMA